MTFATTPYVNEFPILAEIERNFQAVISVTGDTLYIKLKSLKAAMDFSENSEEIADIIFQNFFDAEIENLWIGCKNTATAILRVDTLARQRVLKRSL